jgi:hypothetical protein
LTEASTVACGTGGKADLTGTGKLTVNGAATPAEPPRVLRPDELKGVANISGCTTQTDPQTGLVQCRGVAEATNAATKLNVGGTAVALDTGTATSNGKHPSPPAAALLSVKAGQEKLTAV